MAIRGFKPTGTIIDYLIAEDMEQALRYGMGPKKRYDVPEPTHLETMLELQRAKLKVPALQL